MSEGIPSAGVNPTPAPQSSGQMMMFMMMFMTMFIMFIPSMRNAVGEIAKVILDPIIGFEYKFPVMTLFLAGFMMVIMSTGIRHYFIDWIDAARNQSIMRDFNKELRDARMAKNERKTAELLKKQPEIMQLNMQSSMSQMKPMAFTMIFIIGTFTYLGVFVHGLPSTMFSIPWHYDSNFATSPMCGFENWIFVYMMVSLSFGQVLQRILKYITFSNRLKELDVVGE